MTPGRKITIAASVVVLAAVAYGVKYVRDNFTVALPDYAPVEKTVWLDQGWTPAERDWFHHANQGTVTFRMPYEWFVAIEQPVLSFGQVGLLKSPTYLDRFGFIPNDTGPGDAGGGDQDLPVGFARGAPMIDPATGEHWRNPRTGADMTGIGLTCAACHTGRLSYQQTTLLIDGGPALTDLGKFRTALGLSLFFTRYDPFRFGRFAERVLGAGADDKAKDALRDQLDQVLDGGKHELDLDNKVAAQTIEEGFARLDALNRIGNQVFALDTGNDENFVAMSAPVHYPRIWDASWFDWVQYNGSIAQPMVRNAGEALGVRALINVSDPKHPLYASTLDLKQLTEMEAQLAGDQPNASRGFNGLRAPTWPAGILPPIDAGLAAKGAQLYKELHCQGCHLPVTKDPEFWDAKYWTAPNTAGEQYLKMPLIDIAHIGTDPAQAEDMQRRKVTLSAELGIASGPFGPALGQFVEKSVNYWYDNQTPPVPADLRQRMNGNRDNGIQAPLQYKARPLDGIWAVPPYLHNGSVPSLYALLSPVAERPTIFYLGNREYDPVNVGYRFSESPGVFKFDTAIRGNHNTGHEFRDGPPGAGVIGRGLSPDERRALIEYLKTL